MAVKFNPHPTAGKRPRFVPVSPKTDGPVSPKLGYRLSRQETSKLSEGPPVATVDSSTAEGKKLSPLPVLTPQTCKSPLAVQSCVPSADAVVYHIQSSSESAGCLYVEATMHRGHKEVVLLDSGCSHSLLPITVRNCLPVGALGALQSKTAVGRMADGTCIPIEGELPVTFKLGHQWYTHNFLVAPLDNKILLGMDFFKKQDCVLDFRALTLHVGENAVSVCDSDGISLQCKAMIPKPMRVSGGAEVITTVRLAKNLHKAGIVEQDCAIQHLKVACTLTQPINQHAKVRLFNTSHEDLLIPAGTKVGVFTVADLSVAADKEGAPGAAIQAVSTVTDSDSDLPAHLAEHFPKWTAGLEASDVSDVKRLLAQYATVFSSGEFDVGRTDVIRHSIPLVEGGGPVKQRPYRHGHVQEVEIERQVKKLKELDLIEECHGAWSSPVVPVRKRDGTWRFCVDYRKLNDMTKKDAYPLPRIDDSLDALGGSTIFSTLDLVSGYWQVELDEDAREKSAFVTRSGLWAWKVMPFGLTSAPATFERLMETVMRGLHWETLLLYLDDVIIFAKDMRTHLKRLEEVLRRLKDAGLKLKPSKCHLFASKVDYLGHVVSSEGVATDPKKVEAVVNWPVPQHKKDVRAFLGTTGYYRRYIPEYTERAKSLLELTGKHSRFHWNNDCTRAFQDLKDALTTAPVLAYPSQDLPFILDTDASDLGTGAVLGQLHEGEEKVVAYYSKSLSKEELNYCATRKELLAIVRAVKHFRPYLWGRKFTVRTDHASLVWLLKSSEPKGQVARWVETLADYDLEVIHRKGLTHSNADGLSRQGCEECCRQCLLHFQPRQTMAQVHAVPQLSDIAREQQNDAHISPVYKALQHQDNLDDICFREESWETKRLSKMREHLQLRADGVLIANIPVKGRRRELTICPGNMRRTAILNTHEQAHLGQRKTTARLMLTWYWPGITAHVRRLVGTCQRCQQSKTAKSKKVTTGHHLYAGRPLQVLGVDLTGPFPITPRGNTQILVVADHFTRWVDAIPIKDGSAETVARALEERVFAYLGIPEEIHSDQGRQFESRVMEECCRLWGCQKSRTAPYHPQGNSVVERLNKTLGNSLRSLLLHRDQHDWDLLLPQIMRTLRATPHTVTGETANYLMLGHETRLPDQLLTILDEDGVKPVSTYAAELEARLRDVGERLRAQQIQVRQEDTDDPSLYLPGDVVWLRSYYRKKGVNPKLSAKYVGPYTIKEVLPYHTYKVEKDGKTTIQHEARIRLHVAAHRTEPRCGAANSPAKSTLPPSSGKEQADDTIQQPASEDEIPNRGLQLGDPPHALRTSDGHPTQETNCHGAPLRRSARIAAKCS